MNKEQIATRIVRALLGQGHRAFFAGGCVRDKLRSVEPKDFDIATSATPEQVRQIFAKTVPVGAQFGVILVIEEGVAVEVATFRTEGGYQDGRRPTQVTFADVKEDARRRDFTVNGLYWDTEKNVVIDYVGGQADIQRRVIKTIGDARTRFSEDHLRMLRAIRFSVQLGFTIDAETFSAVQANAALIAKVSHERIRDELIKILTSQAAADGIRLLDKSGLLIHILPEIERMKGVEQPADFHPEGDVFTHTLLLLEGLKEAPIALAMAALLHDVAKPVTFIRADRIRFNGHDKIGAEMAYDICKRLTFPNDEVLLITALVREHLRFKDVFQMRVSTLKRFLSLPRFDLHLELHRLDCLASHGRLDAYEYCREKYAEHLSAPPPPLRLLTGTDLIRLGYVPGPGFSKMISAMEDAILEGTLKTREEALSFIQQNYPLKQSGKGENS